jgi:hypothetical protein
MKILANSTTEFAVSIQHSVIPVHHSRNITFSCALNRSEVAVTPATQVRLMLCPLVVSEMGNRGLTWVWFALTTGFSSTTGVQIAMRRFNNVTYHAGEGIVDLGEYLLITTRDSVMLISFTRHLQGPGLIWDTVYQQLAVSRQ